MLAVTMSFHEIIGKLGKGSFNIHDIEDLIEELKENAYAYNEFTRAHEQLLKNPDYNMGMLTLAIAEPKLYDILAKHARTIKEFKSFVKALAVNIVINGYRPIVRPQTAASTLLVPHKYASLYNPLIIGYIHQFHHEYYLKNFYRPLKKRLILYVSNPAVINTFLFRDLLLFASMVYEPSIAETLYRETGLQTSVSSIFRSWRPKIDEDEASLIVKAYLDILSSQLVLIRAIIRSVNYMYEDMKKTMAPKLKDTVTGAVLQWYAEAGYEVIKTAYTNTRNVLLGYTGSLYTPVMLSIAKGLSTLLGIEKVLSENIFKVIETVMETYYYENLLSEIGAPDTPGEPSLGDSLRAVKEIRKGLENILVLNKDLVHGVLSRDTEPYKTLRKKLEEISNVRGQPIWLVEG